MNNETLYKRVEGGVIGKRETPLHPPTCAPEHATLSHWPPEIWRETGDYTLIEPYKYISNVNHPDPFSAVLHTVLGIVRWLIGFITLTEEDRLAAGIYIGGEGRDDG
jgi:hypothetical protein